MSTDYTIDGYELIEQIGSGERTEVWRATQVSSGGEVALKVIPSRFVNPLTSLEQHVDQLNFIRDNQLAEAVALYDFGVSGPVIYFATELIDGQTVADWITAEGQLAVTDALNLAECVVLVLNNAWKEGALMHGSLSPDNIMIDGEGNVRIADLGLAEVVYTLSHRPQEASIFGSAHYVSPRQALGSSSLDYHADIYALGAVLWHAMTGQVPFGDLDEAEARHAHIHEHLQDPREARHGIPTEMIYLIEKMMAKELPDRFGAWDEVVEALEAVREGVLPEGLPIEAGNSTLDRITHFDNTVPMAQYIETIQAVTVRAEPKTPRERVHAVSQGAQYQRRRKQEKTEGSSKGLAIGLSAGGVALVGLIILAVAMSKKPVRPPPMTVAIPTTQYKQPLTPPGTVSTPPVAVVSSRPGSKPRPTAKPPVSKPPQLATTDRGRVSGVQPLSVAGPDIGLDKYVTRGAPKGPKATPVPPASGGPTGQPASGKEPVVMGDRVAAKKTGSAVDALAGHDPETLLWKAGRLNGLPLPGTARASEFKTVSKPEPVIFVADPSSFVQTLGTNQAVSISLKNMKAVDAVLHIALAAPVSKVNYQHAAADFEQRQIVVEWNDRVVWRRWLPAGHTVSEVFIPGAAVLGITDTLVIRNTGRDALTFDAVWINRHSPGKPLSLAVEGAYWQAPPVAQYVSSVHVRLPALPPGDTTIKLAAIKGMPTVLRPSSPLEAATAYKKLDDAERGIGMLSPAHQTADSHWRDFAMSALKRNELPVIEIDAAGDQGTWILWAQRYGGVVGHWILRGNEVEVSNAAKWIRTRVPNASVSYHVDRARFAADAVAIEHVNGLSLSRAWGKYGARTDMVPGQIRTVLWGKGYYTGGFDHWLTLLPSEGSRADVTVQRLDAWMLSDAAVQWWMAGGRHLIVSGGNRGGAFFPEGSSSPSLSWEAMKILSPVTAGRAQRVIANVVPVVGNVALADTYWVATENSDNLVSLLVVGGRRDESRDVLVAVPVPWKGATLGQLDTVQLNGRENDPSMPTSPTLKLTAVASSKDPAVPTGLVMTTLRLNSLQLLRLYPAAGPAPTVYRHITTASVEGPRVTTELVKIHDKPLPPGAFTTTAAVRSVLDPVDRLSSAVTHTTIVSKPSSIEAYKDVRGGTITCAGVTPWGKSSDQVNLWKGAVLGQPNSVRLYLNQKKLEGVERIAFWIRGVAPPAGDARVVSLTRASGSVYIGTPHVRQKVRIVRDKWSLCSIKIDDLREGSGDLPEFLAIGHDPSASQPVSVEVHGYVGLTMPEGERPPVLGYVKPLADGSGVVMALVGRAGVAGEWRYRVAKKGTFGGVKKLSVAADLVPPTKVGAKLVPPTKAGAKLVPPTKVGAATGLRTRFAVDLTSGKRTAVVDSFSISYSDSSRLIRASTQALRTRQANPSAELLNTLFPNVDWAKEHPADAVVLIKLVK